MKQCCKILDERAEIQAMVRAQAHPYLNYLRTGSLAGFNDSFADVQDGGFRKRMATTNPKSNLFRIETHDFDSTFI